MKSNSNRDQIEKLNRMKDDLAQKVEVYNQAMLVGKDINFQLSKEYHSIPSSYERISKLQAALKEFQSDNELKKRESMQLEISALKKEITALEKELYGGSHHKSDSLTTFIKHN